MFSAHKNSFLQLQCDINPRIINRCIQRARDQICIDEHDVEPPFLRLVSEQPNCPIENLDVTRRPVGFGRFALPKLRRELHDKDKNVVLAALTSICDLVHDPEKANEALSLRIPDRMVDLLEKDECIKERVIMVLKVLANLEEGKSTIISNNKLIDKIKLCAVDSDIVKIQFAALLEVMAISWPIADALNEFNFIQLILENLSVEDEILILYLETLKSLMYCNGKNIAIDNNAFYKLFMLLDETENTEILSKTLNCLMLITETLRGKKLAYKAKLLLKLNKLLYSEDPDVYTNTAKVIMICTIRAKGKVLASTIKNLPQRLIELCQNHLNRSVQIFAIQALTNMCEYPTVRKEVSKFHSDDLAKIKIRSDDADLKLIYERLFTVVNWTPTLAT